MTDSVKKETLSGKRKDIFFRKMEFPLDFCTINGKVVTLSEYLAGWVFNQILGVIRMKRTTTAGILLLAVACLMLSAQESGRQRFRNGEHDRARQDNSAQWAEIQAALKKKYPEKFKEIENLQAVNLFAALERMRELASEASMKLPSSRGGFRGDRSSMSGWRHDRRGAMGMFPNMRNRRAAVEAELKKKYPAEYAEVEKQRIQAENKLEALAAKANVELPATMESVQLKMAELKNSGKFRAEFEEIERLRTDEPRAAYLKTWELMQKAGVKMPEMRRSGGGFAQAGSGEDVMPRTPRVNPVRQIMALRKKYPAEMRKLDALRRDDPEAYRQGVMKLLKQSEAGRGTPSKQ